MNTHALLDQHPSVQALNISHKGMNQNKAVTHSRNINARPFTTASAVERALKGGRKEERDNRITVVRHETNITAAAVAAAQKAKSGFTVTPTTKIAQKRDAAHETAKPTQDAAASAKILPPIRKADQDEKSSLVSSEPSSFEPTSSRAQSFSDYSCSCCHPRKTPSARKSEGARSAVSSTAVMSSTSAPLSAYENMSSISERIAKERKATKLPSTSGVASSLTAASMTSSKLKVLEEELEEERRQRKKTEEELASIKVRQEMLLSRLSEKDREEVRKLASQNKRE